MTAIEWTDETWNPIVGCSIVSPGCTNCYAMKMAARLERMGNTSHYAGTTMPSKGGAVWTGKLALAPESIMVKPLRWQKPRRIFVNSMGDLFHEDAPDEWLDLAFAVMALGFHHTYQVLTKRAERMRAYTTDVRTPERIWGLVRCFIVQHPDLFCDWMGSNRGLQEWHGKKVEQLLSRENSLHYTGRKLLPWPLPNVWLGVSTERQKEADERIPLLLETPAAVRFISAEPLIGPISLTDLHPPGSHIDRTANGISAIWKGNAVGRAWLDWVIVGGESGPGARPMHPQWPRSLRDQCKEAAVPFFFKQWGEWEPHQPKAGGDLGGDVRAGRVTTVHPTGSSDVEVFVATGGRNTIPGTRYMRRVGKKTAGRLLDGREYSEFPELSKAAAA